jgi:hypothetical protein
MPIGGLNRCFAPRVDRLRPMRLLDPIVSCELPLIQKIIEDETWYEGERRNCWVSPDDPVVRENVCQVILRIGRELRESVAASARAHCQARSEAA